MVGKIAEGMKDLCLGDSQRVSNVDDRLPALVQRRHMPHGDTQAVDDGFTTADAADLHDVRVFCFNRFGHDRFD